jgi:hypothetical protein
MTDQEKLDYLERHGITNLVKTMEDYDFESYVLREQSERVIRLEHALLRVLCEIDRKFEQGRPVSPTTHEVKTAWKVLREPRTA